MQDLAILLRDLAILLQNPVAVCRLSLSTPLPPPAADCDQFLKLNSDDGADRTVLIKTTLARCLLAMIVKSCCLYSYTYISYTYISRKTFYLFFKFLFFSSPCPLGGSVKFQVTKNSTEIYNIYNILVQNVCM